jgi:hypothetical protein
MKTPATSGDLRDLLGEIDDLVIERILETRASPDEVAEALADFEDERRFGEGRELTSARAAEVRAILEDLIGDDDDDEVMSGYPA